MMLSVRSHCYQALLLLFVAWLLAGCADQPAHTPLPVTTRVVTPVTAVTDTTRAAATISPTERPSAGLLPTTTGASLSPRTVIRTFVDSQERTITLYYGRGAGRRGDWGWAHILGKHFYGEWQDGGPVTTFDVIGVTTPEGVIDAIRRSLQDPDPAVSNGGRRLYRMPARTGRYEILTVVGDDGAIITAYPDPIARGR